VGVAKIANSGLQSVFLLPNKTVALILYCYVQLKIFVKNFF